MLIIQEISKVFRHFPSNIVNFSSILKQQDADNLITQYGYFNLLALDKGDVSFHEINNVHGSSVNLTNKDTLFVVYRYECRDVLSTKR